MRHGDKVNNLGRKKSHRVALLKNLACSLIEHKRIITTVAKAKALRIYIEPLLTKSKTNTTHSRRVIFSYLQNKEALKTLFGVISEKIATRPGGYVRIIKTGFRKGDGAQMAMIELVDFNEILLAKTGTDTSSKKRTRRSGGSGKKAETTVNPIVDVTEETEVKDYPVDNEEEAVEVVESHIEEVKEDVSEAADDVTEENKEA
jgi:large subunit ribosomal protein L17